MKRLTTIFLLFLFAFALQGQTVITNDGKVIRAYDTQQPLKVDETCEVWYEGKHSSSFTLDGTSVDRWKDLSGNNRHCNNTNADATRPTWDSSTGRVTFTAANSTFLQSAAFASALTQPNIVFVVYKITGALNATEITFGGAITAARNDFLIQASSFSLYAGALLSDGATNVNDNIHVGLFNGASSEYWINGILKTSGDTDTRSLDGITLGARDNLTLNANCEIMEVIVFGVEVSDKTRDILTGYLAWKWDISATTDFKGYIIRQDYCIESHRIFAAMGTQPDADRKRLIDNFVRGSIANGVWSKLDFLYILAAHAENSSLLNWINPGTFDATNVHSTAFEVDRGYTGDGANDYLNSNYNPNSDGVNYTLNDGSLGIYLRNTPMESRYDIGANDGSQKSVILPRYILGTGRFYVTINQSSWTYKGDCGDVKGLSIANRVASNDIKGYVNKINITTTGENVASIAVVNLDLYILCYNNSGVAAAFSTKQVSAAFAGGGMTQTNVNDFTDDMETFMDAIGAGIID